MKHLPFIYYAFLLVIAMVSCSSNDEDEVSNNILQGTIWQGSVQYNMNVYPEETFYNSFTDEWIKDVFPDFNYSSTTWNAQEYVTTPIEGWNEKYKLSFAKSTCTFEIDSVRPNKTSLYDYTKKTTSYVIGTYKGSPQAAEKYSVSEFKLFVTLESVLLEITTLTGDVQQERIRTLENGQYTTIVESELVSSQNGVESYTHKFVLNYYFKDNNIYIENEDISWICSINNSNEELIINQVKPENKTMYLYK